MRLYNSKLKVLLKFGGGGNMVRLVSGRVWPGYSGVNMDKGIPGRRKAEKMQHMLYACYLPLSIVKCSKRKGQKR